MTKTLNQIFFSSPKSEYFFQQHWESEYPTHKTETNITKNTTQCVLDTTIYSTQDEDKQNKKHNTIYVGHHYTQTNTNNVNKTLEESCC
jgi:hypothetical protein